MGNGWGKAEVRALAEPAVAAAAPEELWLLDATCAAYLRPLRRRGRGGGRTEEMLGFGLDASVSVVTIAAVGAAQAAVAFLAAQVADAVREESSGVVKGWVHKLFRRAGLDDQDEVGGGGDKADGKEIAGADPAAAKSPATLPSDGAPLGPDVLRRVRDAAFAQAQTLGATKVQAGVIADAIVGRLAVSEAAAE